MLLERGYETEERPGKAVIRDRKSPHALLGRVNSRKATYMSSIGLATSVARLARLYISMTAVILDTGT